MLVADGFGDDGINGSDGKMRSRMFSATSAFVSDMFEAHDRLEADRATYERDQV